MPLIRGRACRGRGGVPPGGPARRVRRRTPNRNGQPGAGQAEPWEPMRRSGGSAAERVTDLKGGTGPNGGVVVNGTTLASNYDADVLTAARATAGSCSTPPATAPPTSPTRP